MNTLIINKKDLTHNINEIKNQVKTEEYTIIGVVKGNGYGLGLEEYSKILVENGIKILAVATTKEAIELRQIDENVDIFNMSSTAIRAEAEELVKNNIILTIGSKESAQILNQIAENGQHIRAHIKVDTGFGRYGFLYENTQEIIDIIQNLNKNIRVEGIFTHFSFAYVKNKITQNQYNRFLQVVEELEKENINIPLKHACNSPAFINYPEMRLNGSRIGSAFLGRVDSQNKIDLKKIGVLESKVAEIKILPKNFSVGYLNTYKTKKETKVAIVPIGYKDGYNVTIKEDMYRMVDNLRHLKHQLQYFIKRPQYTVIINDKQYNVIGKIGMYHLTVDITNSDVKIRR